MSSRGKAALKDLDRTRSAPGKTTTQATPAAPTQPEARAKGDCGCGCNGDKRAASTPRNDTQTASNMRATVSPRPQNIRMSSGRAASLARRKAMSSTGKAGLNGSGMSEAQSARAANPKLTGRELAKALRADRCRNGNAGKKKAEPVGRMRPNKDNRESGAASDAPWKVGESQTGHGQTLTGSIVGRSSRVTGNEPGTCKNITGVEYIGADQSKMFCSNGNQPGPMKVGISKTLRGGTTTGTMIGRSSRVTGDEPGSCRNITGDDYIGQEQYSGFCDKTPAPKDRKVGVSQTYHGKSVSGSLTDRSSRVTGNEPGTCNAITGTPYAGAEQYKSYCEPDQASQATARMQRKKGPAGSVMTGIQPGLGGKATGDRRGACEPLTGTPYVGADQFAEACPATPAEPGSPDFPQQLGDTPWGKFSIQSPVHASQGDEHYAVTGSRYEQGKITGPFGMADGKVTGTEEARFGQGNGAPAMAAPIPRTAEQVQGRVKPRISGEGIDVGLKITGDDWDRGDRVTGTEGMTATKRNPTRQGRATSAMQMKLEMKRNEDVPEPTSPVTGSSGNTEKGSLVTYSGGARG